MELSNVQSNGQLDNEWQSLLSEFKESDSYKQIQSVIDGDAAKGGVVYPPVECRFRAFELTPLASLRCVIIGQDPYHQEGQANGLAFSVNSGISLPPSLRNILSELQNDIQGQEIQAIKNAGDLSVWAKQGVLLLNTVLSVQASKPLSHSKIGWEALLPKVIDLINTKKTGVVFVLWGKHAQSFKSLIDQRKHFVIEGVHPSPLSANRGFFGSKPFSKINQLLTANGKSAILW